MPFFNTGTTTNNIIIIITKVIIIIIIIEGLSLLQSIPPTTANKQKLKHRRKGGAWLENC